MDREMAIGNTFGATVLSSYGGFWISAAIVFTPGGFEIMPRLEKTGGQAMFYDSFSIYLWVSTPTNPVNLTNPIPSYLIPAPN